MTNQQTTESLITEYFGGKGGMKFDPTMITSIGLRGGSMVDAIIINGEQFGSNGGKATKVLHLGADEYISKMVISHGRKIDCIELTTNKGNYISAGSPGGVKTILENIRVVSIGGRVGKKVDELNVTFAINYNGSDLIAEEVPFILDFVAPNTKMIEYEESRSKTIEAYSKITETMFRIQTNASVEAEYFAKMSASTEIEFKTSETTKIEKVLEKELTNRSEKTREVPSGYIGLILTRATIMGNQLGAGTDYWMYTTHHISYAVIKLDDIQNILNHYDLTGVLSDQMPKLKQHRTEQNGYTYYKE